MQLDQSTGQIIYTLPEQFQVDYNAFGIKVSEANTLTTNNNGLSGLMTNTADSPVGAVGLASGQSASQIDLASGFIESANFIDYYIDPADATGWQINSDGSVQFNNGLFRGALTVGGNAWHVDVAGNMWWGPSTTYAGATIKISASGSVNFTTGTFSGTLSAASGTIGGWHIGPTTLYSGTVSLDSFNTRIEAAVDVNNYVEMYGNAYAPDSYIHGQVGGDPSFYFGYKSGGTYNILNNLRIADTISTDPSLPDYPYAAIEVDTASPNYMRLDIYNSAVNIHPFYFNGDGSFVPESITLNGVNRTTWPSGGTTTLSGLTIDVSKNWGGYGISALGSITSNSNWSYNVGTAGNGWNITYTKQLKSGSVNDQTIDLGSEAANILTNKNFVPSSDNSVTSGSSGRRWSDLRSVLINGVSFLSEKNVIRELNDYDFLTNMPRVIEFTWKATNDANQGKTFWGFAADDLPSTISDIEGKSANVMGAIAFAYGAIKQLRKEINLLKAK